MGWFAVFLVMWGVLFAFVLGYSYGYGQRVKEEIAHAPWNQDKA